MKYKRLTADEKVQAALLTGPERMRILFERDLTLGEIRTSPLDIVGGFDDDGRLHYYYWLYRNGNGERAVGFGMIGSLTRGVLAAMMDVLDFLLRDGPIVGEINRSNKISRRIALFLGGEIISEDPQIVVKFKERG